MGVIPVSHEVEGREAKSLGMQTPGLDSWVFLIAGKFPNITALFGFCYFCSF